MGIKGVANEQKFKFTKEFKIRSNEIKEKNKNAVFINQESELSVWVLVQVVND